MTNSPRRRTVLFLISDTGAGHRSAANAITAAMRLVQEQYNRATPKTGSARRGQEPQWDPNWRAVVVDGFAECAQFPLRRGVFLYGPAIKHSPRLYSRLFHMTNTVSRFNAAYRISQPFLRQGITELLERYRPDVIVSVHPLLNHITLQAMRDIGIKVPFITVITDLVSIHTAWVAPGVTACVTPTPVARDFALAAGVASRRVRLLGMPIDPKFASPPALDKCERREALGLDPDLPTILLVGGGEGAGGLERAAYALGSLSARAQLLVVTGRNRTLYTQLQRDKARFALPTTVFGFVHNMPELMWASDVVATKAGPGSISEAMACELPIVLTGFIPGQEEGNVDYVIDNGLGMLAMGADELTATMRTLLNPGSPQLAQMRANVHRLRRPQASFDIAKLILSYVPPSGASSAWSRVAHLERGGVSRALGRRHRPALRGSAMLRRQAVGSGRRQLPLSLGRLRGGVGASRRAFGLPSLTGARALLRRSALRGPATLARHVTAREASASR